MSNHISNELTRRLKHSCLFIMGYKPEQTLEGGMVIGIPFQDSEFVFEGPAPGADDGFIEAMKNQLAATECRWFAKGSQPGTVIWRITLKSDDEEGRFAAETLARKAEGIILHEKIRPGEIERLKRNEQGRAGEHIAMARLQGKEPGYAIEPDPTMPPHEVQLGVYDVTTDTAKELDKSGKRWDDFLVETLQAHTQSKRGKAAS